MLDKDAIKESLDEQDITKILTDLGSQPPKRSGQGDLVFTTVCHHGDSQKLYYYQGSLLFRCYTGCSSNMDIYELVMKSKGIDFTSALRYVADVTSKHYQKSAFNQAQRGYIIDDWNWLNRFKPKEKSIMQLPTYSKQVLSVFNHNIEIAQWIAEGISIDTMRKFNIGYYINGERITMPHFDIEGNLIGIRGRTTNLQAEEEGKKYMPLIVNKILYNHPTAFSLYGLYQNLNAIKKIKKVLIFESEKSVLKCQDFYGDNNFTVAVCGSNISNYQRDVILSLGVEEVFIAFDKEYSDVNSPQADIYAKKLLNLAYKFAPFVQTYVLFDEWDLISEKDSPADNGKEVLEKLMQHKFEVATKQIEADENEYKNMNKGEIA